MRLPTMNATSLGLTLACSLAAVFGFISHSLDRNAQIVLISQAQAQAANTAPAASSPGTAPARPSWEASATGRVEPKDGQIAISAQVAGKVADVAVKINERVIAGDLLVRIEEDDLLIRIAAATSEAQVRERERDEEVAKGLALERRQAEDAVTRDERSLYRARLAFDDVAFKARFGRVAIAEVDRARSQIATIKDQLAGRRDVLSRASAKEGMPLSTRVEASLAAARAELALAEAALERTRVRAPTDGTVLNVLTKFGELVAPSAEAPLVMFGDLSALRVKAEVEDRDATKIRVGQRVIVRGDAYPDKEFTGAVTSVSQALSSPRIATRGVRRPNDVEVIEAVIALDGTPPLLSGMRVDVFFQADKPQNGTPLALTPAPPAKTN
jgi:HlyD family secretion protein